MKAYRIVREQYADRAFDGGGAKRFGGRWNPKGMPAVYLSSSESLAQLEMLVHLGETALLQEFVLFELEVPDNRIQTLETYPQDWRSLQGYEYCQEVGRAFLNARDALALEVCSSVVPRESNLVLNVEHPEAQGVIENTVLLPFSFDPRLKG
ncbi:MAG: RES family NAD+ phosphorylase [Oleiphilaceae bacterium]|nr:RES family NAD+ phosphorylase [Oleiphilaceae bacterium]